jgi:hypothetical protein
MDLVVAFNPLDQFEIRSIIELSISLFNNLHLSLTNIGLYLIISLILNFMFALLSENNEKLLMNKWSLNQESLVITVKNLVINQISGTNGQIYFPFIYTLFMFILINNLIGMVTRCLSFIKISFIKIFNFKFNKYLVKIYSSHISNSSSVPKYSSNNKNYFYLHPYYITGFIDGEGCFSISMFKDSRMFKGWQVKPIFSINLHNKDIKILEAVQRTLGVGKLYKHGKNSTQYRISYLKNIYVIINHLDKYPLITKKWANYLLFKEAVKLIKNKEHLTLNGLQKIVNLKASLNLGLADIIK